MSSTHPSVSTEKDNNAKSSFGTFAIASSFLGHLRRFNQNSNSSNGSSKSRPSSGNSSSHSLSLDPPPLSPLQLSGFSSRTKTRVMTPDLAEEIRVLLPARNQLYDNWSLVYSLEQHGASLTTLYHNSAPPVSYSGSEERTTSKHGYVLVVKDTMHKRFGAYVNEYFHPSAAKGARRFYGNGDCFLWSSKLVKTHNTPNTKTSNTKSNQDKKHEGEDIGEKDTDISEKDQYHIQFKGFPYTGVNDFVIYCSPQFLSLGGGDGHYGLWLNDSLSRGVSSHSLTFGNEPLSDEGTNFGIVGVEVWKIG